MTTNVLDNVSADIKTKGTFWGATLMVAGTCIGGGMLAMPVQAAQAGFGLAFFSIILCWAFMTFTGLLLIEATLWVKNEAHFTSISRTLVGSGTKILAMVIYLFMNYLSLIAYTSGASLLLNNWCSALFGFALGHELGCVIFVVSFGLAVALGIHFVGWFNSWLMVGLVLSLIILISFGVSSVDFNNLEFRPAFMESFGTLSLILATFSYQMVVPSICSYLNYDVSQLRRAILTGTTISLSVYLVWIFVVHGIVPWEGENGLKETLEMGGSATIPLRSRLNNSLLGVVADVFAFLAVATSFLGLSIALFHFLGDCFKELKIKMSNYIIILLTMLPTLALAIQFEKALIKCLDISGGFGDTILSGLIPVTMVWVGRYYKKLAGEFTVPGGKPLLIVAAVFYLSILLQQFFYNFW